MISYRLLQIYKNKNGRENNENACITDITKTEYDKNTMILVNIFMIIPNKMNFRTNSQALYALVVRKL